MSGEGVDMRTLPDPPIELERIICGLDGSPESLEGARVALEIAAPCADVVGVLVWNSAEAFHAGIHRARVARNLRTKAEAALRAAQKRYPSLRTQLVDGDERSALIKLAERAGSDLICVGSHGSSRVAGVLLGSTATATIRSAPCSVLVAREPTSRESPRRIVHAADGSKGSLEAARVAAVVAGRTDAEVLSVHIGDDDAGRAILEEAAALISAAGVEVTTRLEPGTAHVRLIEVASEDGAAMIVSGARGVRGVKALGSVSERVAHEASCSVLIVRREAADLVRSS
jgi:nucleotide-binding universal stress UspA family protein